MGDARPDEIVVVDSLFPPRLRARLAGFIEKPIWRYGHRSNGQRDRFPFWSASIADAKDPLGDCSDELQKTSYAEVREAVDVVASEMLAGYRLNRVYANAHTYGADGYPHTDSGRQPGTLTCVIYIHPVWRREWGGELIFFDRAGVEIVKAVSPKAGRAVIFSGHILHCARGVSRECNELRVSLVVKGVRV